MKRLAVIFGIVFAALLSSFAQCPTLSVIGPKGLTNPGDDLEFRVDLVGNWSGLRFAWSVDRGTITHGQGTPVIVVLADREPMISFIQATVNVTGLPDGCKNLASESAPIAPAGWDTLIDDEYGKLSANDERARLDAFIGQLSKNPNHIGLVALFVTPGERYDSKNRRLRFILSHLLYRKFDKRRIWFSLEKSTNRRTTLSRYPQDVIDIFIGNEPPCKPCLIIKGADIDKSAD